MKKILLILFLFSVPGFSEIQSKKQISILHGSEQFADLNSQYCFKSLNICQKNVFELIKKQNPEPKIIETVVKDDYNSQKSELLAELVILTAKNFPEVETSEYSKNVRNLSSEQLRNEILDILLEVEGIRRKNEQ